MTTTTRSSASFDYLSLIPEDGDDFGSVPSPRWRRPQQVLLIRGARTGDHYLEFVYSEPTAKRTAPARRMLRDFLEIARGDEPENSNRVTLSDPRLLLAFARKYGPLGICGEHNLSCWHALPPCPALFQRKDGIERVRERTAAWLTYSRLARAIVNLVAKPEAPERRSDLKRLDRFFGRPVAGPATAVNYWLSSCRIGLRLHGDPPRLALIPLPVGLAQLGTQLALVVAHRDAIALCDGCARLFEVKRQPRQDRSRYCPKCGDRISRRNAKRRERWRRNEVAKLDAQGKSAAEIATALKLNSDQVDRYLDKES